MFLLALVHYSIWRNLMCAPIYNTCTIWCIIVYIIITGGPTTLIIGIRTLSGYFGAGQVGVALSVIYNTVASILVYSHVPLCLYKTSAYTL